MLINVTLIRKSVLNHLIESVSHISSQCSFLYPLKAPENLWCFGVFIGYYGKIRQMANGKIRQK